MSRGVRTPPLAPPRAAGLQAEAEKLAQQAVLAGYLDDSVIQRVLSGISAQAMLALLFGFFAQLPPVRELASELAQGLFQLAAYGGCSGSHSGNVFQFKVIRKRPINR